MKHRITFVFVASLLASGCSTLVVPESIRPANERLTLTAAATGVQIYECRSAKAGGFQWTFVAPEATLFDQRGRVIGAHGAGPFWEATDGSRVVGQVKARADAPAAAAIPWLLLNTKSTAVAGSFSAVTSIQRINTAGGLAPTGGCDAAAAGTTARVPYSADYVFFTHHGRLQ
jgi:hypothetical protein